jgi:hypothetical protein
MTRKTFLTVGSLIALGVGLLALVAPDLLLASKGVSGTAPAVWTREVGVALIAVGATAFAVRGHDDSPTLRAFLYGNLAIQLGLLPIEPLAWHAGVITSLAGIVPNTVAHLLLAAGFSYYAVTMPAADLRPRADVA